MATGGTGAGPEPLGRSAHGPGAGPGPRPGAGCGGGGWVGVGTGPCALGPKGSGLALVHTMAMYFQKKGIEISYVIDKI